MPDLSADQPDLHGTPAANVARLRELVGADAVAGWCADLLTGRVGYDDPGHPTLEWLGGAATRYELQRGRLVERGTDYWPRVWAARGLLHSYLPAARAAVVDALRDPAWRVREMAAKVIGKWEVDGAAEQLLVLAADPVARVRSAAVRALAVVGEAECIRVLRDARDDADPRVRADAERAVQLIRRRLDRPL